QVSVDGSPSRMDRGTMKSSTSEDIATGISNLSRGSRRVSGNLLDRLARSQRDSPSSIDRRSNGEDPVFRQAPGFMGLNQINVKMPERIIPGSGVRMPL